MWAPSDTSAAQPVQLLLSYLALFRLWRKGVADRLKAIAAPDVRYDQSSRGTLRVNDYRARCVSRRCGKL